jgi:hypothetical protein
LIETARDFVVVRSAGVRDVIGHAGEDLERSVRELERTPAAERKQQWSKESRRSLIASQLAELEGRAIVHRVERQALEHPEKGLRVDELLKLAVPMRSVLKAFVEVLHCAVGRFAPRFALCASRNLELCLNGSLTKSGRDRASNSIESLIGRESPDKFIRHAYPMMNKFTSTPHMFCRTFVQSKYRCMNVAGESWIELRFCMK